MKSKTTTKFILIFAIILLAVYLLYPTYQFNSMSEEEKERMNLENQKEFFKLKSKTINLGLDLQGGMHVVLEVNVHELLDKLAKNKNEVFITALNETAKQVEITDEDFISVFYNKLEEQEISIVRYYGSPDRRDEDDVLEFLRDQTTEAVDRCLEILRNRVDQFGVSEPTIQKQGNRRVIIELAGVTDPARVRGIIGETAKLEFKILKDNIVSSQVAEKINEFIVSQISPSDTLLNSEDEEKADRPNFSL